MAENTSTITEWSVDGLLDEISHLNSNMKDRSLAFILGAGASISSGIPAGGALAKKWLEDIHLRENLTTSEKIEIWTSKKLGIDEFQLHDAATYYAKIFELRFGCDPQSGYAALEAVMEEAEPSVGYAILAKILDKTRNKVVVTTNFDNLVADALALQALRAPLIVGHESLTGFINPRLSRPLVAKIHRDLHLHPKNDQDGIHNLEQGWQEALSKLFQHYTPLVIGYGGNDESLMGFLSNLHHQHIPGRLFWCYREGDYPQQRILDVVSRHRGVLVAIAGFDELMVQLAQAFFPKFTLDDIAKEISEIGIQRTIKYKERASELMERIVKQNSSTDSTITQQALQSISEVSKKTDSSNWWYWDLLAKKESDIAKAKAIYDKGLKKLPNSAELYGNYANFLKNRLEDYKLAQEKYKKSIELDPNNANNTGNYANFLTNQLKDYDTAETMYKRAIELNPNHVGHIGNYAIFLANQRGNYDAAEAMYKRALELDPNHASHTGNYAIFLADQRGDYDAADVMFKRALDLNPNNANHILNYANFLIYKRGDYDAAETMYKRAIDLDPNNANVIGAYANFLEYKTGNYNAAETMYKQAIDLDPDNAKVIGAYANFLEYKTGNYDAAEIMYKRAIALDPNNLIYTGNYAKFLTDHRADYATAEAMYKRAIEIDNNNINSFANYTAFLLTRDTSDDRPQAQIMVKKVIEISKQKPSQALAEALLYHCLLEEMTFNVVSSSIGCLKELFKIGYERDEWNFSKLLDSCLPKIASERHDFYRDLATAILDHSKVTELDKYSWWRDSTSKNPFYLLEQ